MLTTLTTAAIGAAFDEAHTRALLDGDDEQITLALAHIGHHLRPTMCSWLRRHMPRMRPEDRDDVWAETMLAVTKEARRRRFDSTRPLLPWLCAIIRNRAIQHLRRRVAWERLLRSRRACADRSAAYPHLGEQEEQATELRRKIDAFLPTLPAMQRTVLTVFLEHWPDSRSTEVLQRKVTLHTGQTVTQRDVKCALKASRRKLRRFLAARGAAEHHSCLPVGA